MSYHSNFTNQYCHDSGYFHYIVSLCKMSSKLIVDVIIPFFSVINQGYPYVLSHLVVSAQHEIRKILDTCKFSFGVAFFKIRQRCARFRAQLTSPPRGRLREQKSILSINLGVFSPLFPGHKQWWRKS